MGWLEAAAALAALRPTATLDGAACTRRHASGCERCASACPKAAIALTDAGATVDRDLCVGCGLCVTACPVDAIDGVGQVPSAVARRIGEGAALRCDVARLLAPEDERDVVDVPCLAGVDPEVLAAGALVAGGATVVPGPCDSCPIGSGSRVRDMLNGAGRILAATPGGPAVVEAPAGVSEASRLPWRRHRKPVHRARPELSRRALFGMRAQEEPAPAAGLQSLPATATPRQLLLQASPRAALPVISATVACTACGGCVRVCPKEALALEGGRLVHDPGACVECGECVRICPEGALSMSGRLAKSGPVLLVAVEQRRCPRCTRPLGPGESGTCHNCRVRSSLADGIL